MKTAFTLLELIIVIVIVGILASFAVPQFAKTRENALGREARANLQLIAAAERVFRMERNCYYPCPGFDANIATINSNLKLAITVRNWNYFVSSFAQNTFTTQAGRAPGFGTYSACSYEMNQNDTEPRDVSGVPGACP